MAVPACWHRQFTRQGRGLTISHKASAFQPGLRRPRGILPCRGCLGSRTPAPSPLGAQAGQAAFSLTPCPACLCALPQPLDDSCPKIMNRKEHWVLDTTLQLPPPGPPACPPTFPRAETWAELATPSWGWGRWAEEDSLAPSGFPSEEEREARESSSPLSTLKEDPRQLGEGSQEHLQDSLSPQSPKTSLFWVASSKEPAPN